MATRVSARRHESRSCSRRAELTIEETAATGTLIGANTGCPFVAGGD
jgi:hypothetical protein